MFMNKVLSGFVVYRYLELLKVLMMNFSVLVWCVNVVILMYWFGKL